jgi:ABC-type branched-subunit amino acid transport system ATPase component
MLRLTRLKITQFRNVQPTELFFHDGYNILLGPNASGKTTLLNLISACVRGDFSEYKREDFSFEFNLDSDSLNLCAILQNQRNDTPSPFEHPFNEYLRIQYQYKSISGQTEQGKKASTIKKTDTNITFHHLTTKSIFINNLWFEIMSEIYTVSLENLEYHEIMGHFLNQYILIAAPPQTRTRFNEELGFYRNIISQDTDQCPSIKIALRTPLTQSKQDTIAILNRQLIPNRSQSKLAKNLRQIITNNTEQKNEYFSLNKENNNTINNLHITFEFKEIEREKQKNRTISSWKMSGFELISSNKDTKDHSILSYGQKRLISFIYYAACNPEIIIADELVNGMHHNWIADCMDLIKDRQSFLTSQNPLLLDHLYFENAKQVQETFIICDIKAVEDGEQITWENITERVGEQIFSAYQVGIQHVSEILKTHGLW